MLAEKVGKHEIGELMPDMNLYEQKVTSKIEESIDESWVRLEEKLVVWD